MSEQFTSQIVADLAPVSAAIDSAADRLATQRAANVAQISGGVIQTTPEQLAAIQANVADELRLAFRERLTDAAGAFIANIDFISQG